MTLPARLTNYTTELNFLKSAFADTIGARAKFKTHEDARYFAMRLQQARTLLRAETKSLYTEGDPKYNTSIYDCLMIRKKFETEIWWIYAERANVNLKIEPLSTVRH